MAPSMAAAVRPSATPDMSRTTPSRRYVSPRMILQAKSARHAGAPKSKLACVAAVCCTRNTHVVGPARSRAPRAHSRQPRDVSAQHAVLALPAAGRRASAGERAARDALFHFCGPGVGEGGGRPGDVREGLGDGGAPCMHKRTKECKCCRSRPGRRRRGAACRCCTVLCACAHTLTRGGRVWRVGGRGVVWGQAGFRVMQLQQCMRGGGPASLRSVAAQLGPCPWAGWGVDDTRRRIAPFRPPIYTHQ